MNSESIVDEIAALVTEVEEGNTDALKAFIELKRVGDILSKASEQIKESALREAKLEGKKSFDKYGCKIEIREGSARFDYKQVPQWVELDVKRKSIEEMAKARAKNPSMLLADGDGIEIPPAIMTFNAETLAISLPKI